MDSYGEFKKEVLKVDSMWELFKPYEGFQKIYIKAPEYLYNLLSSGNLEIDNILSKLEKKL